MLPKGNKNRWMRRFYFRASEMPGYIHCYSASLFFSYFALKQRLVPGRVRIPLEFRPRAPYAMPACCDLANFCCSSEALAPSDISVFCFVGYAAREWDISYATSRPESSGLGVEQSVEPSHKGPVVRLLQQQTET